MKKPSIRQLSAAVMISIISLILGELEVGTNLGVDFFFPTLLVMPFVVAYVFSLVSDAEFLKGEIWVVMAILYAGVYFHPLLTLSIELAALIAMTIMGSIRLLLKDKNIGDRTLAWSYLLADVLMIVAWAVTYTD